MFFQVDCDDSFDVDPQMIEAESAARAAEQYQHATDPDCSDGNSCWVYVRENGTEEFTAFRVTTSVEVTYTAREIKR